MPSMVNTLLAMNELFSYRLFQVDSLFPVHPWNDPIFTARCTASRTIGRTSARFLAAVLPCLGLRENVEFSWFRTKQFGIIFSLFFGIIFQSFHRLNLKALLERLRRNSSLDAVVVPPQALREDVPLGQHAHSHWVRELHSRLLSRRCGDPHSRPYFRRLLSAFEEKQKSDGL